MTVPQQKPSIEYLEDGVTLEFPVPFYYRDPADVRAFRTPEDGPVVQLVNGEDFTASAGDSENGGTLTLVSSVVGAKLSIRRETPRNQGTDYETNGEFTSASHERALDKTVLIAQEQDEEIARTPKVPRGENGPEMAPLAELEGKVLSLANNRIVGIDNDPAAAVAAKDTAIAERIKAEAARAGAENATNNAEAAALDADASRVATLEAKEAVDTRFALIDEIAGAALIPTWTELDAVTGMAAGDTAVIFEDAGTHTDPVTAATVDNAGLYIYRDGATPGWERFADPSEAARQVALAEAAADRAEDAQGLIEGASTLGNVLPNTSINRQTPNGAEPTGSYGIRFPNGTSGQNSVLQPRWDIDGAAEEGRTIRIRMAFDQSAVFTRVFQYFMQVFTSSGVASGRNPVTTTTSSVVGNRRYVTMEYTIEGDELIIQPFLLEQSSLPTTSDETITITEFVVEYLNALGDILSPFAEALERREVGLSAKTVRVGAQHLAPAGAHSRSVIVAPTGGDYTTVTAALAAIGDASALNRYKLVLPPQVSDDGVEWTDKDYVDLVGQNRRETVLQFHQPNNTTPALGASESLVLMRHSSRIEGMTMTAENARYVIHLESDGNYPDRVQEIVNCHIEHLGNDELVGNYWGAQYAIGSGNSSGQVIRIVDTDCISKRKGGFSYHTNKDFAAPSRTELIRSRFIARQAGEYSFSYKSLGSFQPDVCYAEGCVFGGDIAHQPDPWLQTALSKQPADHNEIRLSGHGNSPAVFINEDFGEALRIDSAATGAASSIVVSGNAAPLIFGDGTTNKFFERKGSAGFSAAVWGWGDISTQAVGLNKDVLTKTLGQRLGNRTSSARTLSVEVDGGAPIDVVFDQDHTAQTNATVIGIINAALGAAATASVYKPGARVRPMFADEESAPKNTSGLGIPFGTVCAFDGAFDTIRPMTSADDPLLFAGVAWEDIAANDRGRVKCKGYLALADILRNASVGATVPFNSTFSIDPGKAGQVVLGGSQGLLRAIRNNAVRVG